MKKKWNSSWDARCGEILRRMASDHHDCEIAASIEAEISKRFAPRTVAGYRRAGNLPPCRRNAWSAPLKSGALHVATAAATSTSPTSKEPAGAKSNDR